jgi:hypothetical protein
MKCNLENHRSFFPQHSTHLPRLRQLRPTRLNPRSIWCILWGPGVRYAFLHTRRPSPSARFQGLMSWKRASIAAIVDLAPAKAHW